MAMSRSRGLCQALGGIQTAKIEGTTLALVDGGGNRDTLTDSAGNFSTCGFAVGDLIWPYGLACASNLVSAFAVCVCGATIWVPTATWTAAENAGNTLTFRAFKRGSYADLFSKAQLDIYSGSKPTKADDTENGTLLVSFSDVRFEIATWDSTELEAYIDLYAATALSATASATGTAGYFRIRGGGVFTTGADAAGTLIRLDGTVGVGTGDLRVASTTITSGAPESMSSFKLRIPQAA